MILPAWKYQPVQANWREQRTEEYFSIRVAVNACQRHPRASLLGDLVQRVVIQQVWEHHLLVADSMTQSQVARNLHTLGLLGSSTQLPVFLTIPITEELSCVVAFLVIVEVVVVAIIRIVFAIGDWDMVEYFHKKRRQNKHGSNRYKWKRKD